jgi:hypothetical protein
MNVDNELSHGPFKQFSIDIQPKFILKHFSNDFKSQRLFEILKIDKIWFDLFMIKS